MIKRKIFDNDRNYQINFEKVAENIDENLLEDYLKKVLFWSFPVKIWENPKLWNLSAEFIISNAYEN